MLISISDKASDAFNEAIREILRTKILQILYTTFPQNSGMSDPLLLKCFKWFCTSQRGQRYVYKTLQRLYDVYGIGDPAGVSV